MLQSLGRCTHSESSHAHVLELQHGLAVPMHVALCFGPHLPPQARLGSRIGKENRQRARR